MSRVKKASTKPKIDALNYLFKPELTEEDIIFIENSSKTVFNFVFLWTKLLRWPKIVGYINKNLYGMFDDNTILDEILFYRAIFKEHNIKRHHLSNNFTRKINRTTYGESAADQAANYTLSQFKLYKVFFF